MEFLCRSRKFGRDTFFLLFAVIFFITGLPVYGDQSILDGARKEGKLVVYTAMNLVQVSTLLQEFKRKYPFLNTEFVRLPSQKLLPRIELEARAKKHIADVITGNFTIWNELKTKGLAMGYKSPESISYPQEKYKLSPR